LTLVLSGFYHSIEVQATGRKGLGSAGRAAMKSAGCILWGLAVALLTVAAFESSLIWMGAPLLGIALSFSLLRLCLYRPPENHLGVIYKFGRLSALAGPDQWIVAIPGIHEIKDPISL